MLRRHWGVIRDPDHAMIDTNLQSTLDLNSQKSPVFSGTLRVGGDSLGAPVTGR